MRTTSLISSKDVKVLSIKDRGSLLKVLRNTYRKAVAEYNRLLNLEVEASTVKDINNIDVEWEIYRNTNPYDDVIEEFTTRYGMKEYSLDDLEKNYKLNYKGSEKYYE
jgi:hypothetical protein